MIPADGILRWAKDTDTGRIFVRPTEDGFRFGVTLDDPRMANAYAFALDTGGLVATLADDRQTILLWTPVTAEREREPVLVGGIGAPTMLDAAEVPAAPKTVTVELFAAGSGAKPPLAVSPEAIASLASTEVVIVYTIDPAWLAAPDRAYPVTLDPDACLGEGASGCAINGTATNFDHFIASGLGSSYPSGWTVFRVGYDSRSDDGGSYGTMRGLVYFQDVVLPDGAMPYDTSLALHISSLYGGPVGEDVFAYRVLKPWGTMTSWDGWGSGGYTTTGGVSDVVPSSGLMGFDVDAIVQSWYTRRGKDWKADIGFAIKMGAEGSSHGEVEFDRSTDATASNRPKLTIHYELPKVSIDFDPALGPNYAPATMVAGQATTLPIRITNNASGFDFNTTSWRVGSRWFDAKGTLVSSASQALTQCIGTGAGCANPTSGTIALAVTPPATVGQYTLRLDLVRNGTIDTFASDWAKPSLFYSRNKNSLSADDTRWTGSSVIERDEFGIAVVAGGGGDAQAVATGDGGSLAIDLWSRDLSYTGAGGVGFDDLIPLEFGYRYDAQHVGDCSGILDACGWSTTYDERLVASTGGTYTYVGPSGTRYLVGADADQQLTSSAPVLLQRHRVTFFDDNVPTGSTTATVVSSPTPFSGGYLLKGVANNATISLGTTDVATINTYRNLRFAYRTASAASGGLGFQIKNVTTNTTKWLVYTLGTTWTTGEDQIALGGTINGGSWVYYTRDIYDDVRLDGDFGAVKDEYEIVAVKLYNASGMTGDVYLDGLRVESREAPILEETAPTWSSGSATAVSGDPAAGTYAIKVAAATIAASPDCHTTLPAGTPCWGTTVGGLWSHAFVHWQWKKIGGHNAAVVFHLKNERSGALGDLTYYAGPTPPPGAVNPIQVSDTTPLGWSTVTRNLLADARQVLNFFNDNAGGSDPGSPPTQGPTPDDVRLVGYKLVAGDGAFMLIDDFDYGTYPDVSDGQVDHPSSTGDATPTYDYSATYRDGSIHQFNNLGLLERIRNRDDQSVELDWAVDTAVGGAAGYSLTTIRAATDGHVSGANTYRRKLALTYAGTSPRTVTVSEQLGTNGAQVNGRTTAFTIATATGTTYGVGDVLAVKPARTGAATCTASGTASGCALFSYTDTTNHRLAFVADPRWNQTTTSGAGDQRFEVTWSGSDPLTIVDRSTGSPILRVLNYSTGGATPAATRAAWQDAAGISKNYARFTDLTSDGRPLAQSIPLVCGAANCATLPSTSNLANQRASASEFDGLARQSTSIEYRCPGVAVSGCTGTAEKLMSRQGTKAGAKVDNYNDPLTAGQVGWTQTPEQYLASVRDSTNVDPDLYRTAYWYDENGQPVAVATPATNARPDYPAAVKGGIVDTAKLKGYWRLGETSGATATDAAPSPHNGTYNGGVSQNQAPALIADSDRAATFDGVNDYVSIPSSLGTINGSFSVESWVKPSSDTATAAWIGSRKSTTSGTDWSFDAKFYYDTNTKVRNITVNVGNGTAWLLNANIPYDYRAGRWYHVVVVVDDAADLVRLVVNGLPIANVAIAAGTPLLADATRLLKIGNNGRDSVTPQWFAGSIDEVAIYSQALNLAHIVGHYQAGRAVATDTVRTLYDARWRPIQVDDQFLLSPGFESGLSDWEVTGSGQLYTATTTVSGDANLHQPADLTLPPSWSSFLTNTTGVAYQTATLLPGQTVRLQVWDRRTAGSGQATIEFAYWSTSGTPAWVALVSASYNDGTTWTGHAWDVTLPLATDGRVRLKLGESGVSGSDTIIFDDAAILTTYGRTTYTAKPGDPFDGLVRDQITFSPSSGAGSSIGEYRARSTYVATVATPAIFPTTVTANHVDGTYSQSAPDTDTSTVKAFDSWGHELTATDQDGVTVTSTYAPSGNGFATDIVAASNGLGETTAYGYDLVGNRTSLTTPKAEVTTTTYDLRGHALTVTAPAPISTVAKDTHDAYGFRVASIANRIDDSPSGSSGLDDVTTTYVYDEYGAVTSITGNTGVGTSPVGTRTTALHDLLGNEVSTTLSSTYDGTTFGGARTTTQHFETSNGATRATATGSRGPGTFAPGGAPALLCPGSATLRCNAVTTFDLAGRPIRMTDANGVASRILRDIAGNPVFTIANYVDGVYSAGSPDDDIVTATQLDLFGRPLVVVDVLNRKTVSTFDALGRTTSVIARDSGGTNISETRTRYTGAGRVDRATLPGTAGAADSTFTWTKTVYDKAGRAIKTLAHYDPSLVAGLVVDAFETPISDTTINNDDTSEAWSAAAGTFIAAGATVSQQSGAASATSGSGRLSILTGSGANTGAEWALDGTFTSGHVYKARLWVNVPSGTTATADLGTAADSASAASIAGNGAWQALDLTWTPTADRTGVKLAVFRAAGASAVSFYADDATVWDSNSGRIDWNIPTETAYDANGQIVASVITPGTVGTSEHPLVTRTAYDALGRVTGVTINEVAGAGTGPPDVNLATTSVYDALGRVDTTTDPTGTVAKFGYDRLGRVTSTILNYIDGTGAGPATDDDVKSTFAYNAASELIGYCPAAQVHLGGCAPETTSNVQAWHYAYDDAGHLVRQTPPVNVTAAALAVTLWEYGPILRLTKTCAGPATITTCASAGVLRTSVPTYDDVGRMTRLDTYSGPSTTLALRTDTIYLGDGQTAQVKYSTGTTPTVVDTLDYVYDALGREIQVKRGSTIIAEQAWNADGTMATRKDGDANALGQSSFTYDWAKRLTIHDLPDAFSTAQPTFAWRLDGLIAARTWSGSSATFGYDGAKRLTGITKGALTETQTYDRDGNVTSEARSFPSVTGDPGTGTQSFTYDALNRVASSTGLASGTRSYAYDRDGNRTSKTEGGVTFSYVHDRTDELVSVIRTGGTSQSFTYDAYGNLTGNAESAVAVTTMTYDLGDKLTGIDAEGTTNDATFTFDALGRFRTRVLSGSTDTYSYTGSGETVIRIANTVAGTTDSLVSPEGDRLGVKVGSTLNWFVPDAHGTIAGSLDATEATIVNAIRYDAYGQKIGSGGAGGTPVGHDAWKYQGRLDISPSGLGTPLYDMSARFYAPGLGAFSQLDTVMGSAQNPLSMNRFLYAHANPATLIDPTGHCAMDMLLTCGVSASAPAPSRPRTYDDGPAQSANPSAAWTTTQHSDRERQFASDRGTSRTATNDTRIQNVDERVMRTRGNLNSAIPTNRGPTASDGGFDIGGAIHAGLDVLGMVPILGAIPDLANGGFYALQGDWGNAAFSLAAAVPLAGDLLGAGKLALKYGDDVAAFAATIGGAVGAATTRYGDDAASALTRGPDDVAAGFGVAAEDAAGTEVVQRWMSRAELDATRDIGLLRGGRGGTHYVTDAANSDPLRARSRLALPQTPEVRVDLQVPRGIFSAPSRVEPAFGMPGGGLERTATGNVPCVVLCVWEPR